MSMVRAALHIARAELRERVRERSFLVVLALSVWCVVLLVPPAEAGHLTIAFGKTRGIYNSAWIGLMLAFVGTAFLPLFGFYLVKGSVERDRRTHVGPILAATRVGRGTYLLGKWLGGLSLLGVILATVTAAGAVMQLVRAEDRTLDLLALAAPVLLMVVPVLALVTAVALLCDVLPPLRGAAGNVVFFLAWVSLMGTSASRAEQQGTRAMLADVYGMSRPVASVQALVRANEPTYAGGYLVGRFEVRGPLRLVRWEGLDWWGRPMLERLLWLGVAGALLGLAVVPFDRFDPARARTLAPRLRARRGAGAAATAHDAAAPAETGTAVPVAAGAASLTPLAAARRRPRPAALVAAELRLLLQGRPWWWHAVTAGLLLVGALAEPASALAGPLPAAFLWAMMTISAAGARPARHGMERLLLATPHPVRWQLPAAWLAGALVIGLLAGGVLLRLVLAGELLQAVAVVGGALFVSALALALGTWSGAARLFELVFLLGWYAALNGERALDFMAQTPAAPTGLHAGYAAASLALVALAMAGRARRLRR